MWEGIGHRALGMEFKKIDLLFFLLSAPCCLLLAETCPAPFINPQSAI
jgi:hypothetical protein